MRQKTTLKSIARELDVSISTVSKALKNSDEIGKETKEKVQAFAKLYNYKPNNVAISLKNKRTKNIGVVIPDIVHHFFTTVFRGIEKYANERGYNVVICISDESYDKEVINLEMLSNGSVDGFIMSLSAETQKKNDFNHLKEILNQGIPIVLFDRVTNEIDCDKVILNDREIAYEAVSTFIADGRKRIALVTTESYFNVSEERAIGYRDALTANNITLDENLILKLHYKDFNETDISNFFKANKIDAVLCVNELFATMCMGIVQNDGVQIPKDIAFMGFTDGMLSKYSKPTLTTVAQHGDKMGEAAARFLIDRIENETDDEIPAYETEIIKATIIQRDSTN
ncbi:LacI family DNA-binding transcriptional regulator [Aurantibacter crassamenti]|uniref:LacI family DNA-binding transcriptional regulator n=1 Tax=Aurantibacter crassamenti TaxID=1837375 RepID=UPI00193A8014|nr:LacI family DNA-binding transcriptional regulator [Aurantibacter crassamenti]MBM1104751.1 LacI family DNA-binding transcriptional regulator [Aurantibacter crassamenti]